MHAEPVELAGAHPRQAPDVERQQHVEVLVLGELARHQLAGARAALPVDPRQRVAGAYARSCRQLGAGAGNAARAAARRA